MQQLAINVSWNAIGVRGVLLVIRLAIQLGVLIKCPEYLNKTFYRAV